MNPAILYTDFFSVQYSLAGAADSNGTLQNLKSGYPDEYWVSTAPSGSVHEIRMDFGSASERNYLLIAGHNFSGLMTSGSILVDAADDQFFTVGLTNVVTISDTDSPSAPPTPVAVPDPYFTEFTAVSKRYWRLRYNLHFPGGQFTSPPRVSMIFVDNLLRLPRTYEWSFVRENQRFETQAEVSALGSQVSSERSDSGGRLVYELVFPRMSASVRTRWKTFVRNTHGRLHPFWFQDVDGKLRLMKLEQDAQSVKVDGLYENAMPKLTMKSIITQRDWFGDTEVSEVTAVGLLSPAYVAIT